VRAAAAPIFRCGDVGDNATHCRSYCTFGRTPNEQIAALASRERSRARVAPAMIAKRRTQETLVATATRSSAKTIGSSRSACEGWLANRARVTGVRPSAAEKTAGSRACGVDGELVTGPSARQCTLSEEARPTTVGTVGDERDLNVHARLGSFFVNLNPARLPVSPSSPGAILTLTSAGAGLRGIRRRRRGGFRGRRVEAFLEEKSTDYSTETVNHLRGYLGRAFNMALRTQRFVGANPVTSVPKRKVPHRLPDYLRPEEIVPVLANVPDRWRCLFAAALYTGMRKGELLGLRKTDVDLDARLITIRRSHDRDTTKGGHADAVPIAAELAPYLEVAMAESKTDLVFPARDGRLLSRRVQLEQVLRRALRRANIMTRWRHTCRRKDCGHV